MIPSVPSAVQVLVLPLVSAAVQPLVTLASLADVTSTVTALVGAYVAYLAYQGHRRNDSPTMRALAVGVVFVAVVPHALTVAVGPVVGLTDAQAILGVALSHTVGLYAIYRTFR